jgi:hypothetical protein
MSVFDSVVGGASSVAKGAGDLVVDTAVTVAQTVAHGAASMWKMAFGEETGAIVDPLANGASGLAGHIGSAGHQVVSGAVDVAAGAASDIGKSFASLGHLTPTPGPGRGPGQAGGIQV